MDTQIWEEKINLNGGLMAEEIRRSLKGDKFFGGIIYYSDLDKIIVKTHPISFVVYYRSHWFAIYISQTHIEIFDSIALIWSDPPDEFIKFLCRNSNKRIKFNTQLQGCDSNICGLYVIFFVKMNTPFCR